MSPSLLGWGWLPVLIGVGPTGRETVDPPKFGQGRHYIREKGNNFV